MTAICIHEGCVYGEKVMMCEGVIDAEKVICVHEGCIHGEKVPCRT